MKDRRSRVAALALILCVSLVAAASQPAPDSKRKDNARKLPFEPAEELIYDAEISRSILRGINIGEMRFTAGRAETQQAQPNKDKAPAALRFTVEAVSKGLLRKLFGLNFRLHVDSTVEPTSFAVMQTTKLDEQGKRKRTSEAVFDRDAGRVVWTERDATDPSREPRVVTSETKGAVQDIASVFYYLRTQPLELGKSFEVQVSDSGRVFSVAVVVSEKKKMKTLLGQVQTLKVEADVFGEGRLIRGKGKLAIWFTADARHIPVRAKINNELGTLDITLKRITSGPALARN
ncbi:MAG TPA: DUF3108 domain-containing protein [Pyrinomonadaceae bacterium]|nr:DUF3108 domain-containing protein [Pyrinomonadaceae bacterium]